MDKGTFVRKFKLHTLEASLHEFRYPRSVKEAAVLIPLIEVNRQLSVILTRRATHLKHHAGQISFPGGKVEPSDLSATDTALREAEEEIGLVQAHVQTLGQLKPYHTITGYNVIPIVGLVDNQTSFNIDENEVAEMFTVPLSHFIDKDNHTKVATYHKGNKHHVYFMPYQNHNIWGATAAMLADLVAHID
ncbi:CoA pyrophosphatase [Thalassotalea sp. M1531]|uniref:CoA pyrophosphatase n=1 Tax=Thalassotalea algicola TaxID=2716224 RepID=A0A7Y0LH70_9GAMM|nr:CoA pyrophosphatase [Thalassotalea algicola]NMP33190.1 CoA pyrophosphatase [Thalassotalea algicola]